DSRNKRDGRSIERLGFYNPVAQGNEKRVELNTERVEHWVSHGAQLTEKVSALVKEVSSAKAAA
ncbi:MAG TPA: 30S ribosomal protein S16, partial [Arenimonas sp.]